jgi:hypothetical protein
MCAAIGWGQSEKLLLDMNYNNELYTSIMVLGDKTEPWNNSHHQGSLYLPTLGVRVPTNIGDMVFFNALKLSHLVIRLVVAEKDCRTESPSSAVLTYGRSCSIHLHFICSG